MRTFKKKLSEQICSEFRPLRQQRKLTIQEIATQTDLSANVIDQIEMGKEVAYHRLKKLAYFYGKKINFSLIDIHPTPH